MSERPITVHEFKLRKLALEMIRAYGQRVDMGDHDWMMRYTGGRISCWIPIGRDGPVESSLTFCVDTGVGPGLQCAIHDDTFRPQEAIINVALLPLALEELEKASVLERLADA